MGDFLAFSFSLLLFSFVDEVRSQLPLALVAIAIATRPDWYAYYPYLLFVLSVVVLIRFFRGSGS